MLDSRSANNPTGTSTTVDSQSLMSSTDGGQLSTVYEVDPQKQSYESRAHGTFHITEPRSDTYRPGSKTSRDVSLGSTIEKSYDEKSAEHTSHRLKHKPQTIGLREEQAWSKDLTSLRDGTYQDSMADERPEPTSFKKPKSRGLRTMIRRLFRKKSMKSRISMPALATSTKNVSFSASTVKGRELTMTKDPNVFITSATDLLPQRSASAPDPHISRSSALGSHAPFSPNIPPTTGVVESKIPPPPDRAPPERPIRPRRASLPSLILNAEEKEAICQAITGIGIQDVQENTAETNIGFAVTSGSNPKRRSRSAGTFRDHQAAKEHRMSPIQWRQWRRRSDEIKFWRESTDGISPILGSTTFPESESLQRPPERSPSNQSVKVLRNPPGNDEELEDDRGDFNFGLPTGAMENQGPVGLEERVVTLEIKLMDFEYAISKLQAGRMLRRDEGSNSVFSTYPQASNDSQDQDQPHSPAYHRKRPSEDSSAPSSTQSERMTTPSHKAQVPSRTPQSQTTIKPDPRPTSVATTLRAGHSHRSSRNSFPGLTVEHYTTLITLIRHEQSARVQLEHQVSALQQQLQLLSTSRNFRNFSGRRASPEASLPRHYRRTRGRSSHYSETDTDDASFHEVYVTPVERGEFEREHLEAGEEGVAF